MGKRVSLDPVRFIVTVNMAAAIRVVVHIRKYSMFYKPDSEVINRYSCSTSTE